MFSVTAKSRNDGEPELVVRPSELPIYDDPKADYEYEYYARPPGFLETAVGDVRRGVTDFVAQYKDTYDYVCHIYETGKAHSAASLDYLQDETNLVPRATFITVGGLTGLLVAALRRRGLLKRLMYTGVGLAVPTAICYPNNTAAYGRWGFEESKKYSMIAYNFLVGAKPDGQTSPIAAPKPEKLEKLAPKPEKPAPKPQEPVVAVVPEVPMQPSQATAAPKPAVKVILPVVGDPGQANPEDADLYTTRSG